MHDSFDFILLITLTSAFMAMLVGVVRLCIHNHRCRGELVERIKALRIGGMLEHIGIGHSRYLRKASRLTIEKHLLVCRQCNTTDICDECLIEGKSIPENTFCRNYRELIMYR
jgi:hypothetical protein